MAVDCLKIFTFITRERELPGSNSSEILAGHAILWMHCVKMSNSSGNCNGIKRVSHRNSLVIGVVHENSHFFILCPVI